VLQSGLLEHLAMSTTMYKRWDRIGLPATIVPAKCHKSSAGRPGRPNSDLGSSGQLWIGHGGLKRYSVHGIQPTSLQNRSVRHLSRLRVGTSGRYRITALCKVSVEINGQRLISGYRRSTCIPSELNVASNLSSDVRRCHQVSKQRTHLSRSATSILAARFSPNPESTRIVSMY
jgi:hypothetical protein